MPWFSAVGLFKHGYEHPDFVPQYEERTVLVRAASRKAAQKKVLAEFAAYARDGMKIEFLEAYAPEQLYDAPSGRKVVEVGSRMRVSDLKPSRYIPAYWLDLRPSSCSRKGWKHAWHNRGGGYSGCLNCRARRKGELWRR